MSQVGRAVGGFFDGLFGDSDMPGVDPAIARQQAEMEAQQKAQLKAEQDRLDKQRTAALRGRFSTGGGGGANQADQAAPSPNNDAQAASLFSRITGRTDA